MEQGGENTSGPVRQDPPPDSMVCDERDPDNPKRTEVYE
jgi:hypothetical protein